MRPAATLWDYDKSPSTMIADTTLWIAARDLVQYRIWADMEPGRRYSCARRRNRDRDRDRVRAFRFRLPDEEIWQWGCACARPTVTIAPLVSAGTADMAVED
jgi:hypothetical protein